MLGELVARVMGSEPRLGSTRLVAIDGPGGAGKSTLAGRLARECDAVVVPTDSFASWDNPLNWWPRLETQVLQPLGRDEAARYQRYDWDRRVLAEWHDIEPGGVVVLEGVSSARAIVRSRLSLSVWVDTPRDLRLDRGLERDGSAARALWDRWMADEDVHFANDETRSSADVIVSGTAELG
ncbi:cytidylate kinase-like protein [Nocardia tenerifensis]|uniref:Cytidylate kinase-like protein n=1 Tax=Nocardia tenerifensis TaxID=228006 RepID=A0A318K1G6_9NOCA|nr:(d)CMP kinase [Nocardia tenerifensis]PXX54075.1 cytidylate kinase-like protein [Nocardia tenerifensis]